MHALEIQQHAHSLMSALGPKAVAEAAQKARQLESEGRTAEAEDWRRIEAALVQMTGPRSK